MKNDGYGNDRCYGVREIVMLVHVQQHGGCSDINTMSDLNKLCKKFSLKSVCDQRKFRHYR